jgi:hypothetical protein
VPARNGLVVRRRRMTIGCIAAALLLHAAIGWMLLRAAAPLRPRVGPQAAVVALRWLRAEPHAAPVQAVPDAPATAKPRGDAARPRPARVVRSARAVAAAPVVASVPTRAPAPIDGGVFALPRIGYGAAGHATGLRAFAPALAMPVSMQSGAQDVLRRQIADHIQRQLAALPAPLADGRCTLAAADEPLLLCDSDALTGALGDSAVPLARMVAAFQRSLPGRDAASIEARAGQFRLLLP